MNEPNIALESQPFLIVSDVHADPESLQRVLDIAPDVRYKCSLGDIVGRGEKPKEAIEMIDKFDVGIMGNHDAMIVADDENIVLTAEDVEIIRDHWKLLDGENLSSIQDYTYKFARRNMILFHGTPDSYNEYIFNEVGIRQVIEQNPDYDLFFGGHLHIPRVAIYDKQTGEIDFEDVRSPNSRHELDLGRFKYVINVPAVSNGRMGYHDPGACVVFHTSPNKKIVHFFFAD